MEYYRNSILLFDFLKQTNNYRSSCQNPGKEVSEKTIGIKTNPLIENGPKGEIIMEEQQPKIPLQFSTTAMVTVSSYFMHSLY